jgi:CRP/FNR family cyclic AMP-dependent transcriptional regulator
MGDRALGVSAMVGDHLDARRVLESLVVSVVGEVGGLEAGTEHRILLRHRGVSEERIIRPSERRRDPPGDGTGVDPSTDLVSSARQPQDLDAGARDGGECHGCPLWNLHGGTRVLDPSLAVESLRRCALFAHVEEEGLRAIASQMRRRRFRRGEVIFHQDDVGDSLQVVVSGSVKIVLPSQEGDEAIIASLHRGDFFGELALLDGAPRSTTAAAVEATETLTLPREPFLALLADDPRIVRALLQTLAEELRRLTGHVEELHFLDLVRLARVADPAASGRVELDWPFTQSDLAAMIGGTRQSVNKLLSGLVDDGILHIERDTLIINDLDQLEMRAGR